MLSLSAKQSLFKHFKLLYGPKRSVYGHHNLSRLKFNQLNLVKFNYTRFTSSFLLCYKNNIFHLNNTKYCALYCTSNKSHSPLAVFKTFWRKYGVLGLGIYFSIWLSFMVVFYLSLESGFLGFDPTNLMESAGLEKLIDINKVSPGLVNVVLAFGLNKLLEPLRIPVAIGLTVWVRRKMDRRALQ